MSDKRNLIEIYRHIGSTVKYYIYLNELLFSSHKDEPDKSRLILIKRYDKKISDDNINSIREIVGSGEDIGYASLKSIERLLQS